MRVCVREHLPIVPKRTVDPTPININHDCALYAFAMECKCVHLSILDQLSFSCSLDIGMCELCAGHRAIRVICNVECVLCTYGASRCQHQASSHAVR